MQVAIAQSKLEDAHDALARALRKYPLRGDTEGCPCCVSPNDHAELRSGNLRRYAFKAMTTWGDETDFKHFLPVMLAELTPANDFFPRTVHEGACDLDCLASKLSYANWQQWPANEQQAVLECLQAWWRVCLSLLEQAFTELLAGRAPENWGDSVEPAYRELKESKLLTAKWLQQIWREAWQPLPSQSLDVYVQSPRFLLFMDWLYYAYCYKSILPADSDLDPNTHAYVEAGFFYYSNFSPELAQRCSDLLYCLEHSPPLGSDAA